MTWATPKNVKCPQGAVTTLALSVCSLALAIWPWAAAAADPPPSNGATTAGTIWRLPERDAANSLYFLMRFHGRRVSYDDVVAVLPGPGRRASLRQVRDGVRQLGLDCGIYESDGADLSHLNRPAIIYMEEGGVGEGGFFVLVSTYEPEEIDKEGAALLLNGGLAILRRCPLDEFRRGWSGHILVAKEELAPSRWSGTRTVIALGGATFLAVCFLASRLRQPAITPPKFDDSSSKGEGEYHVS